MFKHALIALSLILLPLSASAQMNDLGLFVSTSQLQSNEIDDAGDIFDVDFDEEMGMGILYNRFWGDSFSTEFAYQRLGADLTASFDEVSEDIGELDLDVLSATAQLHFARGAMISPYIGVGAAYISGEAGSIDTEELESVDLENSIDILANAGINVGLGRGFALFLDGKYIMYEANGEDSPEEESLELNPLILAGGVKFRF